MANKNNRKAVGEHTRRRLQAEAAAAAAPAALRAKDAARKKGERLQKKLARDQQRAAEDQAAEAANDRSIKSIAAEVRSFFFNKVSHLSAEDKGAVLRNVVDHREFKRVRESAGVAASKQASINAAIVENAAGVLQTFNKRGSLTKERTAVKRAVVSALVSDQTVASKKQTATAKALGIKRHSINKAVGRRNRALTSGGLWALTERTQRSDALSSQVREQVVRFWTEHTRVLPNEKDVRRHRLGRGQYESHPIHLLEKSQTELFFDFIEEYPAVKIKQRRFEQLKPWFVRKLKDRNVCCCKYHEEVKLLLVGVNRLRRRGHTDKDNVCECDCDCAVCRPVVPGSPPPATCQYERCTYASSADFCGLMLCPKPPTSLFHQPECIERTCPLCKDKTLPRCPLETQAGEPDIVYQVFEYVPTGQNDAAGRPKKRIQQVEKSTSAESLFSSAEAKLNAYAGHSFRAKWQDAQFRKLIATFPKGTVVSVIDFAENYSFQVQHEIQSMHWHNDQVTILVHITYRHAEQAVDGRESGGEDGAGDRDIVKELHFYISDDKDHGTVFVQHCLVDVHFPWLQAKGVTINKHDFFSDGAASQFKSAHAFYFDTRYLGLTGVPLEWNFFESGHGKGEHDGMGALVKSALRKWQLLDGEDAPKLTNAKEVVDLLKVHLSSAAPSSFPSRADQRAQTARFFHLIKVEDVANLPKLCCETVPGTRKIHSLKGSTNPNNPTVLRHKELSCFCGQCWAGDEETCENKDRTGPTCQVTLRPVGNIPDALVEDEDEEPVFGGDHNELSGLLQPGDTFAVPCDDDADYYLAQCTRSRFRVEEDTTDGWGTSVSTDDMVVEGIYFTLKSKLRDCHKYILNDKEPKALIFSHLVRSVRFDMPPESEVERRRRQRRPSAANHYTLDLIDHESILQSLDEVDL